MAASQYCLRSLCLLALVPALHGLRLESSGPGSDAAVALATQDSAQESAFNADFEGDPKKPKFGKHEFAMHWDIEKVEQGGKLGLFWESSCGEHSGKDKGDCILSKSDSHSTPGLMVNVSTPLDENARYKASIKIEAAGGQWKFDVQCKLCGDRCHVELPLGQEYTLETPACPLPAAGFQMAMPHFGTDKVPAFVKVKFIMESKVLRGDGTEVGTIKLRAWV
mmetsp:Transcript_13687/g.43271  ORF Transcript_13687/g.43271 Transcript_13687/m.43271 type:complete len:222 (-) Transcript_13687:50-715(-)|eukprot:CAMPEP_0204568980 /NCGR_PEP_ID=MMETSP0661-20131031/37489_1 /ASSEMBLY_ACC=CAM_ASM_000606 /TAXON_ID=109239 /ORGANISM="Alexandrium margalefi, Strain AMGDE01CS-322" /LENGTH=221 /DNA_ID=CAMNT_0051577041 /DNA_START=81 /DNA_END=746 /DNA_ORIENTATION=-